MITPTLEHSRQILQQSRRACCFSGAGLSAESGIATFRDTASNDLWSRFDPMKLASPEGFAEDPVRVIDWYNWRRQTLAQAQPNAGHLALASQPGLIHVTQNVDNLLELAGCASNQVIHLHGDITLDRCNDDCGYQEAVDLQQPPPLRRCPRCDGWLRPAVVWFGEALPQRAWQQAESLVRQCDTLLVVGTSASVYPAAGLIQLARQDNARIILINTQPSVASNLADAELIGTSGTWLPLLLQDLRISGAPN